MDSTISTIVSLLWSPVVQKAKLIGKVDRNVKALISALDELKLAQAEVNRKIQSGKATTDQHEPTDRANKWLKDVQDVVAEVNLLVEAKYSNRRKTCLGCLGRYGCSLNYWLSYKISKKATNMTLQVKDLIICKEEKMEVVTERLLNIPAALRKMSTVPEPSTTDRSNVDLDVVCGYIEDVGVGMVGIYGMGGVGKTSLLKRTNNHHAVAVAEATFDHVIFVVVSQKLNLYNLQKAIAENVGFQLNTDAIEERGESLGRFIKTKKILLLLDDIWEPFELEKLGIHNNNEDVTRHKVVFTTRSENVYNQMISYQKGVKGRKVKVECMDKNEAWQLFLENVGEAKKIIDSNKKVHEYAKKIANKCGGLPLALIVTARNMSSQMTWHEWEVALDSLNAIEMDEMWSKESDPFPLLKHSYDRLRNDTVRNCFLFCALWPEDAHIDERDLISGWLGWNLIKDFNTYRQAYNRGIRIIQDLKGVGLLEEVEDAMFNSVKMHYVVRGMALWIATDCETNRNKWIVESGEVGGDLTKCGDAEMISLSSCAIKILPQHLVYNNISVLFLFYCKLPKLPDDFFQNMPTLSTLIIEFCNVHELPSSIGCLVALRYLFLNELFFSLPIELLNLTELKYLRLGAFESISIPCGMISKLKKLENFEIFGYQGWNMAGEASLEELGCSVFGLKALGLDIYTVSMLEQITSNPRVTLLRACLFELKGVTTLPLLNFILDRDILQELIFLKCKDLEEVVMTGEQRKEEEFTNLQIVTFARLLNLQRIKWVGGVVPGVVFRNVTMLHIKKCPRLKNVTWIGQLPCLQRFELDSCRQIEQVISDGEEIIEEEEEEEEIMHILVDLKYLVLRNLPKLSSFSSRRISFNSLKFLCISKCPLLDLTPFSNHTIRE